MIITLSEGDRTDRIYINIIYNVHEVLSVLSDKSDKLSDCKK